MPFSGDWFSDWFGDWFGSEEVSALSGAAEFSVGATGTLSIAPSDTGGGDGESRSRQHEEYLRQVMLRRQDEEELILALVQFVIAETVE